MSAPDEQKGTRQRSGGAEPIRSPKRTNSRNLVGEKFGFLEVESESDKRTPAGQIIWICKCKCGTIKPVSTGNLLAPPPAGTKSCGCMKGKKGKKALTAYRASKKQ